MLAPVVFTQTNGKRIAIDAYDVCTVAETDDGQQITFMPTNEPDIITVEPGLDEILDELARARAKSMPRKPREGDEWKEGYDDEEF